MEVPTTDTGIREGEASAAREALVRALSALPFADAKDLEPVLWDGFCHAREVWPTAEARPSEFAERVLAACADVAPGKVHATLAALRLDDLYLATACAAGHTGAILAFEHAFFGEVARAFAAASHGEAFLDDARQNLRERLFVATPDRQAGVSQYRGRGSLRRWFRMALTHHTLNLKRSESRAPELMDGEPALVAAADPELLYLRERYGSEFRAAVADGVARLSTEERAFLRHHYVERLTIDQIAAIYRTHRVTAARRVNGSRDELVRFARAALTARLRGDAREMASILRLLPTQFSFSFQRVLAGG